MLRLPFIRRAGAAHHRCVLDGREVRSSKRGSRSGVDNVSERGRGAGGVTLIISTHVVGLTLDTVGDGGVTDHGRCSSASAFVADTNVVVRRSDEALAWSLVVVFSIIVRGVQGGLCGTFEVSPFVAFILPLAERTKG